MQWHPSSSNTECLRVNGNGVQYEDFGCLYPTIGKTFLPFEKNFDAAPMHQWMIDNPSIPIVAVILYGIMILGCRHYYKDRPPLDLRGPLAAWNLALSVFSLIGVLRVVPMIVHLFRHYTVTEIYCTDPESLYGSDGGAGLWALLFVLSKLAELIDTWFIVVRKKKLIFLHWYHHITVLLMCWHAYVTKLSIGILITAVNYSVHTVMYFYYFLMAIKCKPKFFKAVYITVGQITQMVIGVGVLLAGWYMLWSRSAREAASGVKEDSCHLHFTQTVGGLCVGISYFFLFLALFLNRYGNSQSPGASDTKKKQ